MARSLRGLSGGRRGSRGEALGSAAGMVEIGQQAIVDAGLPR